ncbi:AraC family transcriptional regulator [Chitinophaga oryzae]|uniref:AraC family transcriptional regulator n=1 Tax=Chitinophaga oryzae TaxID=2725414 RepID=A0AAE7D6U5_9BACT|nr:helix-turn-helix domain-containing protein [Chitinophaga oryzae]QJB32100.1 AraC family transcriptional regulator [Chitinophaga oryzae]QJB38578.1 AraC family transcriptional regulator [Chitinophaga oryzae]
MKPRMKAYTPHPALQDVVSSITIYEADFARSPGLSNMYRFVPTYQRYIMFYIKDPIKVLRVYSNDFQTKSVSLTVGPLERAVTLDLGQHHLALGVAFKPGGLFRLLNIPMTEMHEQDFDTSMLLGNEIKEVNEQLQENTHDWDLMLRIVQTYLLKKLSRLKPILPVDLVMNELVTKAGNATIETLAADACVSVRQFERKVVERTGMSPKRYARLIRFCKAYHLKELHPEATWTRIAHMSGYYDQMHFIRDFKEFAGITPSFINETELINTVRLHRMMTR